MGNDLKLPTEKTKPRTSLSDYTILLYGREKIGKTTFAAQFPDVLFLETEPGTRALSVFSQPIVDWTMFVQAVKALEGDKRFKTVVIDTADNLYDMCLRSVCRKKGIDHPADEEYGSGWSAVRKEFVAWNTRLVHQGRGVIWTSHETDKGIKKRGGEETTRICPTLSGQGRKALEAMVDIMVYYGYEDDERFLMVRGSETITAGNRLENRFPEARIAAGSSPAEAYARFVKAFQGESLASVGAARPKMKVKVRAKIKE